MTGKRDDTCVLDGEAGDCVKRSDFGDKEERNNKLPDQLNGLVVDSCLQYGEAYEGVQTSDFLDKEERNKKVSDLMKGQI